MTAGTSSIRTTVASMRIAEAMPTPITLRTTSGLGTKAANTATMIAAAAVMTRAGAGQALGTLRGGCRRSAARPRASG